jgi:hypothetical protein
VNTVPPRFGPFAEAPEAVSVYEFVPPSYTRKAWMELRVPSTYESAAFSHEIVWVTGLQIIRIYYFVVQTYENGLCVCSGLPFPYENVVNS